MRNKLIWTAASAALLTVIPFAAQAADREAVEASLIESVDIPADVAALAEDLVALLAGFDADAQPTEVEAAINALLVASAANEWTIAEALALVLDGTLDPLQEAAIYRLFAVYSPPDVVAPSGGSMLLRDEDRRTASTLLPPPPVPPSGGGSDYDS